MFEARVDLPPEGPGVGLGDDRLESLPVGRVDRAGGTQSLEGRRRGVPLAAESTADGAFELVLRDSNYPDGTVVSVQPGQGLTSALPNNRTMVGNSYEVVAAATQPLGSPATVRIYYTDAQLEGRMKDTLRIYRYDEAGGWEALAGSVVANLGFVQVKTDRLSPFALFAEPATHRLSLPLACR